MPIPFTCLGCQAAFDMPDNMAGMTVRCTACDKQLAVPKSSLRATGETGAQVKVMVSEAPSKESGSKQGDAVADEEAKPKRKKKQKQDEVAAAAAAYKKRVEKIAAIILTIGLIGCLYYLRRPDDSDQMKAFTAKNAKAAPEQQPPPKPEKSPPKAAPNPPAPNWQAVSVSGMACEMPGTPKAEPLPGGVRASVLMAPDKSHTYFALSIPVPADFPGSSAECFIVSVGEFERAPANGPFGGLGFGSQFRVSSPVDVQQDGFPAKELQLAGNGKDSVGGGVVRFALVGKQMYAFGVRANNYPPMKPQAQRFLASVKITKTSDDRGPVTVAPKPPDPGLSVGVGDIPGNLKAKLNSSFFTGAFDPENKELVVVGLRTGGTRQAGSLQRYSYPDFKHLGTVNIPSVATRAQIDSQKGLLYVTTAGSSVNPFALSFTQFDRPAYQGDVAVYDLTQLRTGKVEEKSNFNPLATIPVGRVIRDMVLSSDNKSLFVLIGSATAKGKSQVLQVSTGDRKVTKSKDLPDPGWEMVWSGDGEKLYVTGLTTGPNPPPLMVLDPGTMTLAPSLALPNAPFNIAVAKDGRIVISSPAVGVGASVGINVPGVPPVPGAVSNPCDLNVLDASGNKLDALRSGLIGVSNDGYVAFTPDGKHLVSSTHHPFVNGTGVDVYETSDKLIGDKKIASMRKAGEAHLGGTFLISPDSEYIVFYNGAVLKLDDLGGAPGNGPPGVKLIPPPSKPPGPG